jgi:predicted tellurium resistance membrane protein TerC
VLFWGIFSALILRGVMIGLGVAFVEAFHWALYLFGVFLLFTGIKMFLDRKKVVDIARNPLAIILSFIGAKMLLADVYHIATAASLGVVGLVLLAAIGLSLLVNRQHPVTEEPVNVQTSKIELPP